MARAVRPRSLRIYRDSLGNEPFSKWLNGLDRTIRARVRRRLDRVEAGNLGDCRSVGEGIQELRLHVGPGYRVYFGETGKSVVLLLCGGDKSTQRKDVERAKAFWKDYKCRVA